MTNNDDGSLSFANKVQLKTFSESDVIYKSAVVLIDFECKYDNVYSGIEADGIKISTTHVDVNTDGGKGKFQFTLTQYMDSELTDVANDDDFTKLGSDLFFKLSMKDPIPELVYSIQECTVKDKNSNLSYPIFTKHCADSAIGVKSSLLNNEKVQTGIRFSYPSFSFVQTADDTGNTMKLICTVVVCDAFETDSDCALGCRKPDSSLEIENTKKKLKRILKT